MLEDHIRRALRVAEAESLKLFTMLVREMPDERLEQLMRSPARRAVIGGIFWQLPQRLDGILPDGVDASIKWRITAPAPASPDTYHLVIAQRRSRVIRGEAGPDPHITVTVDAAELLRLLAGNVHPMRSYFTGKLKLSGDIVLALRLIVLMAA